MGLEAVDIQLDQQGYINVDQPFASNVEGIYALTDTIVSMQLTPVAIAQGEALASYLFKDQLNEINLDLAPTTAIANPPATKIGLTEQRGTRPGF